MQPSSFSRFEKLIGNDKLSLLKNKSVLILDIGGVGGYVAEACCRSGVGTLIIVDFDIIDITNINRQIIALNSTIGMKKVDVLEKRLKDINKDCNIIKLDLLVDDQNINTLFSYEFDYLVDACDMVKTKEAIIKNCLARKIKFISCMGTAKRLDPSLLEITDIRKTYNDPLARKIRKFVNNQKIKSKIDVLFSREVPIKIKELGSSAFVPSSAGLLIASYIIRELIDL